MDKKELSKLSLQNYETVTSEIDRLTEKLNAPFKDWKTSRLFKWHYSSDGNTGSNLINLATLAIPELIHVLTYLTTLKAAHNSSFKLATKRLGIAGIPEFTHGEKTFSDWTNDIQYMVERAHDRDLLSYYRGIVDSVKKRLDSNVKREIDITEIANAIKEKQSLKW